MQENNFNAIIQTALESVKEIADGNTVLAANADKAILYSMQTETYEGSTEQGSRQWMHHAEYAKADSDAYIMKSQAMQCIRYLS